MWCCVLESSPEYNILIYTNEPKGWFCYDKIETVVDTRCDDEEDKWYEYATKNVTRNRQQTKKQWR